MARKQDVCADCGHKQGCEFRCAAWEYLERIYQENKTKEKRQLIKRLRKYLDIMDAEPSNEMEQLAEKVIRKVPELSYILDFSVKIGYVTSAESKTKGGKDVFGDCRKVNKVYGAYLPYDFVITFYEPNISHLSENQIKLLMWHELRHIGVGERGFIVEPHEIEDFLSITDQHSTRWGEFGAEVADILG